MEELAAEDRRRRVAERMRLVEDEKEDGKEKAVEGELM